MPDTNRPPETDGELQARESEQVRVRRAKLTELREAGPAFPNDFKPDQSCNGLVREFGDLATEEIEARSGQYRLGGRILVVRDFGKSSFLKLQDGTGSIQLFANKTELGDETFALVRRLDAGDIVGVSGRLFRTRTGELTLRLDSLRLLVK